MRLPADEDDVPGAEDSGPVNVDPRVNSNRILLRHPSSLKLRRTGGYEGQEGQRARNGQFCHRFAQIGRKFEQQCAYFSAELFISFSSISGFTPFLRKVSNCNALMTEKNDKV